MIDNLNSRETTQSAWIRRIGFWVLSFSSILALLLHLPGIMRMRDFGVFCGIPAVVLMIGLWLWGRAERDEKFLRALKLGLIGGLLGTLAYDVFRIPFHLNGANPFSPIRVYGLWLLGGEASDWVSDLAGFLYHLSNGVTFGWIYAMCMSGRHWSLAVIWGLGIETIAILTAFGSVFGLVGNPQMMILALAAHVAYGVPLGLIVHRAEKSDTLFYPLLTKGAGQAGIALALLVTGWFLLARPAARPGEIDGNIVLMERGLIPSWSDLSAGESRSLENRMSEAVTFRVARPGMKQLEAEAIELAPGESAILEFSSPGVTRIHAPEMGVRSVYGIVHRDGDYRPELRESALKSEDLNSSNSGASREPSIENRDQGNE